MCKSWCEAILAVIIIVFSFVPQSILTVLGWQGWIIFIAAIVLLVHSFSCKSCFECADMRVSSKKRR